MVVISPRKFISKLHNENEFMRIVDEKEVIADLDLIDDIISGERNLPELPPMAPLTPRPMTENSNRFNRPHDMEITSDRIRRIRTIQHNSLLTEYTPRGSSYTDRGIYDRNVRPSNMGYRAMKSNISINAPGSNMRGHGTEILAEQRVNTDESSESPLSSLQRDTYDLLKQICLRTNQMLLESHSDSLDRSSSSINHEATRSCTTKDPGVARSYTTKSYTSNTNDAVPISGAFNDNMRLFRGMRSVSSSSVNIIEISKRKRRQGCSDGIHIDEDVSMLSDISQKLQSTVQVIKASLRPFSKLNWFLSDSEDSLEGYRPNVKDGLFERRPVLTQGRCVEPRYGSAVLSHGVVGEQGGPHDETKYDPWSVLTALWTDRGLQDSDVKVLRKTALESATDFWTCARVLATTNETKTRSDPENPATRFYKFENSDSEVKHKPDRTSLGLDIFNSDETSDGSLDPIITKDSLVSKVRLIMDMAPYNGSRQLLTVSILDGPLHVAKQFAQKFRLDGESRQALCIFLLYLETDSPKYPIDVDCNFSDIKKYFSPKKLLNRMDR